MLDLQQEDHHLAACDGGVRAEVAGAASCGDALVEEGLDRLPVLVAAVHVGEGAARFRAAGRGRPALALREVAGGLAPGHIGAGSAPPGNADQTLGVAPVEVLPGDRGGEVLPLPGEVIPGKRLPAESQQVAAVVVRARRETVGGRRGRQGARVGAGDARQVGPAVVGEALVASRVAGRVRARAARVVIGRDQARTVVVLEVVRSHRKHVARAVVGVGAGRKAPEGRRDRARPGQQCRVLGDRGGLRGASGLGDGVLLEGPGRRVQRSDGGGGDRGAVDLPARERDRAQHAVGVGEGLSQGRRVRAVGEARVAVGGGQSVKGPTSLRSRNTGIHD